MGGTWRNTWETTSFTAELGDEGHDRLRVRIRVEQDAVVRFAVQYEAQIGGDWHPVVRYDSGHGYGHRDRLDRHGRNIEKLYLGLSVHFAEIVTSGIDDIKTNWQSYREAFLRRDP